MTFPSDATAHDIHEAIAALSVQADDIHSLLLGKGEQWDPAAAFLYAALQPLTEAKRAGDLAVRLSPPRPKDYRKGGWIRTHTGRKFWPLDPRPEDIDAQDIAYQLAGKYRYQASTRYDVATHSVAVMRMAVVTARKEKMSEQMVKDIAALALLHDADEAYLPDIPRPVKEHIPGWGLIELAVRQAAHIRFGLTAVPYEAQMIIKEGDDFALALEIEALGLDEHGDWPDSGVMPVDPDVAEAGRVELQKNPLEAESAWMRAFLMSVPAELAAPRAPEPEEAIDDHDPEALAEAFLALPPPERVTEHGLALSTRMARLIAGPVDVPQPGMLAEPKQSWMREQQTEAVDPRVERNRRRLEEDG